MSPQSLQLRQQRSFCVLKSVKILQRVRFRSVETSFRKTLQRPVLICGDLKQGWIMFVNGSFWGLVLATLILCYKFYFEKSLSWKNWSKKCHIVFVSSCTAFQNNGTVCQLFPIQPSTYQITDSHVDPNVKTMIRDKLYRPWQLAL